MARINPKLNLNKTPQLVENNSLVFAKNIRRLKDGTIGPDTSLEVVETNSGDSTHHVEHHEAVVETLTNVYYSILDYENTIAYTNHDALGENPEFIFGNDVQADHFDDFYKLSDKSVYSLIPIQEIHKISCYKINNPSHPVTCTAMFRYDINNRRLVEIGGLVLFVGIREEICNNQNLMNLPAPTFFYFIGLKQLLGTTITNVFCDGANYVVFNPVYQTVETVTSTIQEAYDEEWDSYDTVKYIAHIVGLNNKVYFFKECNYIKFSIRAAELISIEYPNEAFGSDDQQGVEYTFDVNDDGYITRNGLLFRDSSIAAQLFPNFNDRVKIFEYDEVRKTFKIVKCAWKYSGGEINGCVSVNGSGEEILTICEASKDGITLVPIKHINLDKCSENDDESFYTQAPNIPISNLRLSGRYIKNIPAGVYQFFIRYKIHNGFYTTWFPCSKELFAGSRKIVDTLQGSIKYTDLHEDSNNSFVFRIEHLYPQYCANYEQFQLGFIISSDGGVFARSWKHFDMTLASTVSIYFDYNKSDIEDINIDDLLEANYDVFNVKNIAQYKNKLYIANYIETDFNEPLLQSYANKVKVALDLHQIKVTNALYLNNIPLEDEVNNVYTTFGTLPISGLYYDSAYCLINREKETNSIFELTLATLDAGVEAYYSAPYNGNPRIGKLFITDDSDNEYVLYNGFSADSLTSSNFPAAYQTNVGIPVSNEQFDTIIDTVIDDVKDVILGIDNNGSFIATISGVTHTIKSFTVEYISWSDMLTENLQVYENGHNVDKKRYYYILYSNKLNVEVSLKPTILTTDYVYNEYATFLPFTKYDFYIHYVKQNGIVTNGYYIGTKEITRYCKQYKPVNIANVPSDVVYASTHGLDTITVLDNIDNIGDLSWYTPDFKEWAWYSDGTTNGAYFKLEEILTDDYVITAEFTNIICPKDYVGCFISYTQYGNNVSQGYNYEYDYDNISNKTTHKVDCLELNCLLYNTNSNIEVRDSKGNTLTNVATYYHSGTTRPLEYLGCSGHVEFVTNDESDIDTKCWLIIESNGKPYNKRLIKLTPFIKLTQEEPTGYLELHDVNGPGYFCEVITLSREYCNYPNGYYISGNDIYDRVYDNGDLKLNINENRVEYHYSDRQYIFSNYNLNYVSLTSDLTPIIRRYDITRDGDTNESTVEEGEIVTSEKQLITLVNSLLASYSLELKGFYREYTRKLYQEYTENKVIKFDNTVRVSSIDVDEIYRHIYRFKSTDYYNVPTHRGIITNLIAVANTLYVHCEHSLFKFTDNKTLNAQEEDVMLQENDIFNSGISEVFDAQYGYAGLKTRKQSLVTYNAYVFYDAVSKIIYAFGGEQQIANIGETIQKIIDDINPTDVQFVGDEINDRFFVNLRNDIGNVCLSFNFVAKSFVSIHDIDFKSGFHTRRHTYFIHDDMFNEDLIGWSIYRITNKININNVDYYIAYQNCYTPSLLSIADMPTPDGANAVPACIDVITNVEYEKIKTLNYINWICSEIISYGNSLNYVAEEELNRLYPGDKLRIYSDSTATELFELVDNNGKAKLANEQRNIDINGNIAASKESWQYPTYNCGVFSINYFRDVIKNGNVYTATNPDLFKYKNANGIGANGLVNLTEYPQRQNLTQENSLIYGKYFVVRLIFNNRNFKVENVTFRMNDYGKTK